MTDRQSPFGPGPTGLYRNVEKGRIGGVCARLADHFGVSPRALAGECQFP